ncbi:MAG: mucoidy inhibitor MuiA family protein [Thermodesulfobacteriota bacterium]|nr:mucoidy inhibitor MuiA family protein [Thermodesulfobacteriota bacterium]
MGIARPGELHGISGCTGLKRAQKSSHANTLCALTKTLSLFFLALSLGTTLCFAQEWAPSRIKEVTLFSNQALIHREANLRVHEGLNKILLALEAFRVDRDSISAKVFGNGQVFSVQFKEIYLKEPVQEKIQVLQQKIMELKESKRALLHEKDVLNKKELFLNSVLNFSQTQVPKDIKTNFPKVEDLGNTLSFLAANFRSINKQKQTLDARIKEIEKEISVMQKELASLIRPHQKTKKVIEVLFDSKKDQEIKVEASYLTQNASWKPVYKTTVPLNLEEVDLVMFSKIQQKTGEDWKDIELSISNVIPLKGVGLPSPSTWTLDVPRPMVKGMGARGRFALQEAPVGPSAVDKMETPADREEAYKKEASFVQAQKEELPLSFEYKMPQNLSIESRDKETMLPLFTKTLKGDFFYYAAPKMNALTFLACNVSADKELLSGPLNVYFGSRFIGKTFLSEKKPGKTFSLNLGADRDVKVKREKTKDKIKETFFGKIERDTVVRHIALKISMENMKDRQIKIKVLDSIPVSRTDKIKVKDIKITPEPSQRNYQDKEGVMLWEFDLQPGDEKDINLSFVVIYPKDLRLPGL